MCRFDSDNPSDSKNYGRNSLKIERFPHPRGDGPPHDQVMSKLAVFSPPAWGWSARGRRRIRSRWGRLPGRNGAAKCDSWPRARSADFSHRSATARTRAGSRCFATLRGILGSLRTRRVCLVAASALIAFCAAGRSFSAPIAEDRAAAANSVGGPTLTRASKTVPSRFPRTPRSAPADLRRRFCRRVHPRRDRGR